MTAPRRSAADALLVVGGVVFVVGLAAVLGTFALWGRAGTLVGVVNGLTFLAPLGFAVAFGGLVVSARTRRRL